MYQDKKEMFKTITKQFVKEAAPIVIVAEIYKNLFKRRTRNPLLSFNIDDFRSLERYPYFFYSNNRQRLKGYMYNKKGIHPNKIIIFAHGFGDGGHHNYLDIINYLCEKGFYVFGYDATGNDESQGESINGFPQGAIDLDAAIMFVEREYPKYPISLLGHSWGGMLALEYIINKNPKGLDKLILFSSLSSAKVWTDSNMKNFLKHLDPKLGERFKKAYKDGYRFLDYQDFISPSSKLYKYSDESFKNYLFTNIRVR